MMRPKVIALVLTTALAATDGAVMSQSRQAPDAETAIRAGSTLFTPVVVRRVNPQLPEAARQIGVTGPVLLEVRIDELGHVSDVLRVVRGHPTLHAAAERAVRQWTFEPHVFEGRAVPIVMTLLVPFAQPLGTQHGESQTTIRVLFAAHGGIGGVQPFPPPPDVDTWFAVVVVEIDSPRELRDLAVTEVELLSPDGWRTAFRRIVDVEEFARVRGEEEGECAYWLNPGGTRSWNGVLPPGSTRLRVRVSLAEEPPPVSRRQLSARIRLGALVAEGPVPCEWPT